VVFLGVIEGSGMLTVRILNNDKTEDMLDVAFE
jgi:hypothetical protein